MSYKIIEENKKELEMALQLHIQEKRNGKIWLDENSPLLLSSSPWADDIGIPW